MRIDIRTCITYKIIISLRRALTETCVEQKKKEKKKEVEVEVVLWETVGGGFVQAAGGAGARGGSGGRLTDEKMPSPRGLSSE